MPMHDWTLVSPGTYHGFHTLWIGELTRVLNTGLLPKPYYAEPEALPNVTIMQTASEAEIYSERRNRLAIRHTSGDRLVAYIELLSSGNKLNQRALDRFLDKACSVIAQGVHLLIVDPYPPGKLDPHGIHASIWNEIDASAPFQFPDSRRLTAVSYHSVRPAVAYVEPLAIGLSLPIMPLFLDSKRYINLPLEPSYTAAFGAIPIQYRERLSQID